MREESLYKEFDLTKVVLLLPLIVLTLSGWSTSLFIFWCWTYQLFDIHPCDINIICILFSFIVTIIHNKVLFLAVKLRLRTVSSELNEVDEQALSIGVIGIGSLITTSKAAIFLYFSFSRIKTNKIKKGVGGGSHTYHN